MYVQQPTSGGLLPGYRFRTVQLLPTMQQTVGDFLLRAAELIFVVYQLFFVCRLGVFLS